MNQTVSSWVWSRTHRAPGRIVDVDELWGQRRYRVWLPSLNAVLLHRPEEVTGLDEGDNAGASSHAVEKVKFAAVIGRILDLLNDDKTPLSGRCCGGSTTPPDKGLAQGARPPGAGAVSPRRRGRTRQDDRDRSYHSRTETARTREACLDRFAKRAHPAVAH